MYFVMSNLTHPTCPEQSLYIFMIKYLSKKPESLKQKQIVIKTSIIVSFFFFFSRACYIIKINPCLLEILGTVLTAL